MTKQELRQLLSEEYDKAIAETLEKLKLDMPITKHKLIAALLKANKIYWIRRLTQIDRYFTANAETMAAVLSVPYMSASATFADRVRSIYTNYESAFHLSQREAKELLRSVRYDRTIADTLRKIAEDMPAGEEKDRILAEISAPAYRYRLQRAEMMCRLAKETCDSIAGSEAAAVREFLQTETERAYNLTVEGLSELSPAEKIIEDIRPAGTVTAAPEIPPQEVTVQPSGAAPSSMPRSETPIQEFTPTPVTTGVYDSFSLISKENVKEIVSRNWSGREFSSSIWKNKEELAEEVKKVLIEGELTGASEVDMAEKISKRFEVGMYEAWRVIRTESNFCTNQADLKEFKTAGVEEYEYGALIDDRTSDICKALDGKRFKVKDAVVGVNFPPMHPFCRSAVLPVVADEDDLDRELRDMMREDGAPKGMSFEEYVEHLIPSEDGSHLVFDPDHTWDEVMSSENNFSESVDNSEKSGIIGVESGKMTIASPIETPIEQRHTGKGNPNAVLTFGIELNNRQKNILDKLPEIDSRVIVPKKSVNMSDLSALTAKTGDEFALFTKGHERLIVRGNFNSVRIDVSQARELAAQGYKWSGHTHPGDSYNCLTASPGDRGVLECFSQETSVIYNSKGQYLTFNKEG